MVAQILESADEIIRKISEQTKKPAGEINELIKARQAEYGGLLTEAGAAYSIAKDLKVETGFEKNFKIAELTDGEYGVALNAVVKAVFPTRDYDKGGRRGNVTNLSISDNTGEIRTVLWNQEKELLGKILPNAKIAIINGYTKKKDVLELHIGTAGHIDILEEAKGQEAAKKLEITKKPGAVLGNVAEKPEAVLGQITANLRGINVSGTIVSVVQPKTFERSGKQGKVASITITDGKTTRRIVLWDKLADEAGELAKGQKVFIENANAKENRGELEVHVSASGKISRIA